MRRKILRLVILLALLIGPAACGAKPEPTVSGLATDPAPPFTAATTPKTAITATTAVPGAFSREQLIEDARQLAEVIESVHPDPYIRGGGRIAFHRRLQRLLEAIPLRRDD